MSCCKCNCNCSKLPSGSKIGVIVDTGVETRDIIHAMNRWKTRFFEVGNEYTLAYNTPSTDFLGKYGIDRKLASYFEKYTNNNINFWKEPSKNVIVNDEYTEDYNVNLISYIQARKGVTIFICKSNKTEYFINLFNQTRQENRSVIFLITVDVFDDNMVVPNFISMEI